MKHIFAEFPGLLDHCSLFIPIHLRQYHNRFSASNTRTGRHQSRLLSVEPSKHGKALLTLMEVTHNRARRNITPLQCRWTETKETNVSIQVQSPAILCECIHRQQHVNTTSTFSTVAFVTGSIHSRYIEPRNAEFNRICKKTMNDSIWDSKWNGKISPRFTRWVTEHLKYICDASCLTSGNTPCCC